MSDIVKRLRKSHFNWQTIPLCHEAADEYEQLQKRCDGHAETLRGIAQMNPETEGDRMRQWARDGLSGYTETTESTVKRLTDEIERRDQMILELWRCGIQFDGVTDDTYDFIVNALDEKRVAP